MINIFLALAGLALAVPAPARVMENAQPSGSLPSQPDNMEAGGEVGRSAAAARVADWIAASGDNGSLPYIIVDKKTASLFLFDAKRNALGSVPVLIGVAVGDDATPGIGSKNLAEIGPAEKTTPAGRFLAKFGRAAGRQKVLWVDYAMSVALHPIPKKASKKERRRQRMLSPTIDDNRITFGCINVPMAFYSKDVRPLFQKEGGYVYVLPDTKPLEVVFPPLRAQSFTEVGALR
ncbi:hypothetical protein [Rhizorhabdus argentea]|uniref:hypothetical protein n=1 Tax=Rhizorhabdus argentea TaxID=1387174 RepID=UPI003BF49FC5